jgi:transglutaminase-like putative cysteine protease
MPKYKIRHITKYSYEAEARDSANQIMLYPIKDDYQEIAEQTIRISGDPFVETYLDYYNNIIGTFTQSQPHQELVIDSSLVINIKPRELPLIEVATDAQWKLLEEKKYSIPYIDFLKPERFDASLDVKRIIDEIRSQNATPLDTVKKVCLYIFENFQYKKGITTVESTLDEIWKIKSGVCQDFAHVMLVMLRQIDIPSRYVSGYICPKQKGMRGEGATHAWVEVYLPYYSWLGIDPTNNCIVNENHVRLAVGKNFSDCSPVKGTYRGSSKHKLEVAVSTAAFEGNQPLEEPRQASFTIEPVVSSSTQNSYRRYQEMQMQQ